MQVDLKDRLEQPHVGALVQADLVLPDVDDEHLARGKCKQGALALKVLVLSALPAVGALDVHDQDVLGHAGAALLALVLAHPDALGRLPPLLLGHDAELCAEEVVEQRRLARRLRAEDGYQVVVEARGNDLLEIEVRRQVLVEDLVLVDDLDAVLVRLPRGILAHGREVRVHHVGRGCGMANVARARAAVDREVP